MCRVFFGDFLCNHSKCSLLGFQSMLQKCLPEIGNEDNSIIYLHFPPSFGGLALWIIFPFEDINQNE
uniref:Uncharacterized protein n=1 Tax=Arundo donax TaxID=35708 RepID=A0A0A9FMU0_ARUDO